MNFFYTRSVRPEMDGDEAFNKMDADGSATIDAEEFAVLADSLPFLLTPGEDLADGEACTALPGLGRGDEVRGAGVRNHFGLGLPGRHGRLSTAVWLSFADIFLLAIIVADVVLKILSMGLRLGDG